MNFSIPTKAIGLILLAVVIYIVYTQYTNRYEITAEEARTKIALGEYEYIVDVRTDKEWDEAHLSNTIHIPIGSLVADLPTRVPNKDSRILFVCQKGIRASGVVTIADKLGYKNTQAMIGNFRELQG
jgi:hydroxyacylglutathione hydrolase